MSEWQDVMQKHARSFHLASLFFPSNLLSKVKALYALCRWLDDAVDEAPDNKTAMIELDKISKDLNAEKPQIVVNQYYRANQLPVGYIHDLIEGARSDLSLVRIKNQQELIQYCYQVAGTVGLAMFDLMKVEPPQARSHAVDLGIAMQITNICRDVKEDLKRNRIYLPLDLLKHHNISEEEFLSGTYRDKQIIDTIEDMLQLADNYYQSAQLAFNNIPWRSRGAIIIAADLYRSIGIKLLRQGGNPMRGRVWLNPFEKLVVLTRSVFRWLFSHKKTLKPKHDHTLHLPLKPWKELRGFNT